MADVINGLLGLGWTIIVSMINLFKTLIGIRNDFLAAALGVSPFIAGLIFLIFSGIKGLLARIN